MKKIALLFIGLLVFNLSYSQKKGKIKNNIYIAPYKLFTISTPHQKGSYEFRYMQVKEQNDKDIIYASFGPAAFNQSIYRVEFTKKSHELIKNVSFDEFAPLAILGYNDRLSNAYSSDLKEIEKTNLKINDYDAYYWVFTQNIPAGKYMNVASMLTHHAYVVDYNIGVAVIWVQIPEVFTAENSLSPLEFAKSLTISQNKLN